MLAIACERWCDTAPFDWSSKCQWFETCAGCANCSISVFDREVRDFPLPSINISGKVWFAHVHKAAGTSFAKQLEELSPRPCNPVECCRTTGSDLARVRDWWFDPHPTCTFNTNEDHLASILRNVGSTRTIGFSERPTEPALVSMSIYYWRPTEPALVSMYRNPVEIIKSHWLYMHGLCRFHCGGPCRARMLEEDDGPNSETFRHEWRRLDTDHVSFCRDNVLARFPETHAGQENFARSKAKSPMQHTPYPDDPQASLRWILNNVQFWGISDSAQLYSASLCLLWYQAGLMDRFNTCSCSEAPGDRHDYHARVRTDEVSAIQLPDDYLASLMPDGMKLYKNLHAVFKQRVRQVERQSGKRFLCDDD